MEEVEVAVMRDVDERVSFLSQQSHAHLEQH